MAQILIVEDDAITALDLQRAVTRMGHTVVARAFSAAEAMAAVQAYRPDVVLLDTHLRGRYDSVFTGIDIQTFWSTPVIYLSSLDPAQLGLPDFPEGLWCALPKPLDHGQLHDVLAQLFPSPPSFPGAPLSGRGDTSPPIRRTPQELREQFGHLRAQAGTLRGRSRHLQQQQQVLLATARELCEDAQRLCHPAGAREVRMD
jgi:CheY-like chemotaxis protein